MATKKKTAEPEVATVEAATIPIIDMGEEAVVTTPKPVKAEKVTKRAVAAKKVRSFDTNEYVTVRNGYHGRLVYRDSTTGMTYEWSEFGDEVDMIVGELQRARSAQPKFFKENWWLFDDAELVEFLRASQFYTNALDVDDFGSIFKLAPSKIAGAIAKLSESQRTGVIAEARKQIDAEKLYDIRVIRALEAALQVELMDS